MEQYILDNVKRYDMLVRKYVPPKVQRQGNEGTTSPDMVVATRLRPLLEEETSQGLPPSVFPRGAQPGVLDVHELRQPPRGPAQLRVSSSRSLYGTESNQLCSPFNTRLIAFMTLSLRRSKSTMISSSLWYHGHGVEALVRCSPTARRVLARRILSADLSVSLQRS